MLNPQVHGRLTVHLELVIADLVTPMVSPDGDGSVDRYVAVVGHVAEDGAETALCHLPVSRFQPCPELVFSPRPLGMQRCPGCFTAYAHFPPTIPDRQTLLAESAGG